MIVIGFSVDYCVHLAHMYTEARDALCLQNISFCSICDSHIVLIFMIVDIIIPLLLYRREVYIPPCFHLPTVSQAHSRTARGRSQHALATMGGTVFGGAITTFGSGAFLFPCQITFFTTMSWLISMTILVSPVDG